MSARGMKAVALGVLALSAPLWILPTSAFNYADASPRAVAGAVVADAAAYVALTGGTCNVPHLTGGTCSFTITNKDVKAQTYAVVELTDPNTAFSSPSLSDPGSIPVGGATTFSAAVEVCISCVPGQTRQSTWRITATGGGDTHAIRSGFPMTATYT